MSIKTSRLGKKSYKSRILGGKSLSSKDSETTMWFDVCPQGCTVFIGKYEQDNLPQQVRRAVFDISGPCEGNEEYKMKIRNFVHLVDNREFVYANKQYIYDYRIFELYLYYPTCDFRPQKVIERELQVDFRSKGKFL